MIQATEFWLIVIAVLLLMIFLRLGDIAKRLRERFPTEKEQDYDWAMRDPHGHWDVHKKDKEYHRRRSTGQRMVPWAKDYRPARAGVAYMKAAAEQNKEGN